LAAMVAGLLLVASVPLTALANDLSFYLLLGLVILLLPLALAALRRQQAGRSRRLGLAGLVLTMIGAVAVGPAYTLGMRQAGYLRGTFIPVFGGVVPIHLVFGVFVGGFVLLLVGLFIFGIAMIRAKVRPRWAALMLALGIPLGMPVGEMVYGTVIHFSEEEVWRIGPFVERFGLIFIGVGLIRLGYTAWVSSIPWWRGILWVAGLLETTAVAGRMEMDGLR
jgi:hypothetical protein